MYQPYLNPDHTPPSLRLPWIGPVRPWRLILLAALVAGCVGVYSFYRGRVAFRSTSPDGKRAVVIREYPTGIGILYQKFRIEVVAEEEGQGLVVHQAEREGLQEFAFGHWARGSDAVDVLACSAYSPDLLIRYQFAQKRVTEPHDAGRELISRAIGEEYPTDYEAHREELSPLDWACSEAGLTSLKRKHPEWGE